MTPLHQRMIDDMRLPGFAKRTQDVYIQAILRLAAHAWTMTLWRDRQRLRLRVPVTPQVAAALALAVVWLLRLSARDYV